MNKQLIRAPLYPDRLQLVELAALYWNVFEIVLLSSLIYNHYCNSIINTARALDLAKGVIDI